MCEWISGSQYSACAMTSSQHVHRSACIQSLLHTNSSDLLIVQSCLSSLCHYWPESLCYMQYLLQQHFVTCSSAKHFLSMVHALLAAFMYLSVFITCHALL